MRTVLALAGLATAALLSACSSAAQSDADEKAMRAETPAMAEKVAQQAAEKPLPVLDAQGNELDPELADAVREKMEEEKAAREGVAEDPSAPTDDGAPTSEDET